MINAQLPKRYKWLTSEKLYSLFKILYTHTKKLSL